MNTGLSIYSYFFFTYPGLDGIQLFPLEPLQTSCIVRLSKLPHSSFLENGLFISHTRRWSSSSFLCPSHHSDFFLFNIQIPFYRVLSIVLIQYLREFHTNLLWVAKENEGVGIEFFTINCLNYRISCSKIWRIPFIIW